MSAILSKSSIGKEVLRALILKMGLETIKVPSILKVDLQKGHENEKRPQSRKDPDLDRCHLDLDHKNAIVKKVL